MKEKNIAGFPEFLAKKAGEILMDSSRRIKSRKGEPGNFATDADMESERFLISAVLKKFPRHAIMSEETRNKIKRPETLPSLWIMDPLDGTSNFFYGIPIFAASIAYAEFGKVIAGAIYDPNRGEMFSARIGEGSYLNKKKIRVWDKGFSGTLANIGSPYKRTDFLKCQPLLDKVYAKEARTRNLGSAALEIAYVACGRFSYYFDWGCRPWDVAAGSLIISEAGGKTEYFGGKNFFDAKGFAFSPKNPMIKQPVRANKPPRSKAARQSVKLTGNRGSSG
jgi:myo-inositol-1(or 4)-monophosphatase